MPQPRATQLPVEQVERLAPRTPLGQPRLHVQAAFADDTLVLANRPVGARVGRRAAVSRFMAVAGSRTAALRGHVDRPAVVEVAHAHKGLKTNPVAALGWKRVDLGGMKPPAAATCRTDWTGVGRTRKHTSARPSSPAPMAPRASLT